MSERIEEFKAQAGVALQVSEETYQQAKERIASAEWPKVGDSLFGAGPWKAEALVGAYSGDGLYDYAAAYKDAADALVDDVLSFRFPVDSVVYPIIFLYRHYVELILKGIIEVGLQLEPQVNARSKEHHRIKDLWLSARPLLEQLFPDGDSIATDAVEKCIEELDSIDSSGEAFRYGNKTRKQGGGKMWNGHIQINLGNIRDVMNRHSVFLDGSYEAMEDLLQCQYEMEADLNSE
jgi:hypothetical protein